MLYLDRICLSFAERYVKEDLGLTNTQMGWLLSAFFWAYAVGQVPAGWLSDRYGVRLTLALYLALWSAFTGWMGLAAGLLALLLLRLGCGLASGIVSIGGRLGGAAAQVLTGYLMVAFTAGEPALLQPHSLLDPVRLFNPQPRAGETAATLRGRQALLDLLPGEAAGVARTVREDAEKAAQAGQPFHPSPEQVSVLTEGLNELLRRRDLYHQVNVQNFELPAEAHRLAQVPDQDLTEEQVERRNRLLLEAAFPDALRKLYGPGWRPVLLCYGAAGLVIALFFWFLVRNRPRQHPGCNAAEVALIEAGQAESGLQVHRPAALPWRALVERVSLWLLSLVAFFTNVGWVFLLTWLPRYLQEEHRVAVETRSWMAGLPLAFGILGMYLGGWLTDRLKLAYGAWWGRSAFLAASRLVVMAAFLACAWLTTPWGVTLALAVVAWATDLGTPAIWAYSQDVGGRHVGSVLGWSNMWGNLGGALSPLLLGLVIDLVSWRAMFQTCAGVFFLAGVCSLGINASRPVVPEGA
jgi:sugar phosphate permease